MAGPAPAPAPPPSAVGAEEQVGPPWLEEEADAAWATARGELGEGPEEDASRHFEEAKAIARRWYHHRATQRGPLIGEAQLRELYVRELNSVYREKRYASVQAVVNRLHLMPEDCRDERAEAALTEAVLSELRQRSLVVVDWALRPKEALAARKEAEVLDAAGLLRPIPAFSGYDVRGDRAAWIDAGEGSGESAGDGAALKGAVRLLRGLALPLQQGGGFGPLRVPPRAMLALYPGSGARYTSHKDSDEEDPRSVTCILYLQTLAWNSDRDGGELSAVVPGELRPKRIEPKCGRLVIFNSRTVVHEVLPSRGQRMALTIWLCRAPAEGGAPAAAEAAAAEGAAAEGAAAKGGSAEDRAREGEGSEAGAGQ